MIDFPPFHPPQASEPVNPQGRPPKAKRKGRGPARKPRQPAMMAPALVEKVSADVRAAIKARKSDENVFADIAKMFQQLPAAKRAKFLDMLTRIFS